MANHGTKKSIKSFSKMRGCKVRAATTHNFSIFTNSQRNLVTARLQDIPTEVAAYLNITLLNTSLPWKLNPIWNGSRGGPIQQYRLQAAVAALHFAVFRHQQRHLNGLHLNAVAPWSAAPRWHAGYIHSFLLLCCRNSQQNSVSPPVYNQSLIYAARLVHISTSKDLLPSRVKYLGWNLHLSSNVLACISITYLFFDY